MNSSTCRPLASLLLGLVLALGLSAQPALRDLAGARSWTAGMSFPTDMALDAQGRAWVVDGINRRLLVFSPGADSPRTIGMGSAVGTALGIDIARGQVWITDTEHRCVHVLDMDGSPRRRLDLPAGCDPVDLLVLEGGTVIADNDNHRLLLLDREERLVRVVGNGAPPIPRPTAPAGVTLAQGKAGGLPGEFSYPGILARSGKEFLVVDVLGGRIQAFTAEGTLSRVIGRFGVDGQSLFRPKGVCGCRDQGGTWVSDGFTGMVLGYDAYGNLTDRLGLDGEVRLFKGPTAVECCGDGLWVLDCRDSRLHWGRLE